MINYFIEKGYKSNRWFKRYFNFIEKFSCSENYEKHHILPKFLFPEYTSFSKNKWNLVKLSPRAHFIAHYLLAKALEDNMWRAVVYMGDTRGFGTTLKSRLYQEAKMKANLALSKKQKGKGNIIHNPEVKAKQKASLKKYYENNPGPNAGRKLSEETKIKQSIAAKNRKSVNRKKIFHLVSPEGELYICEGNLKATVIKLKLSLNVLKTKIGKIIPKETRNQYNTELRKNTTGWLLTELQ